MDEKQWFGLVFAGIAALALGLWTDAYVAPKDAPGAMSPEAFAEQAGREIPMPTDEVVRTERREAPKAVTPAMPARTEKAAPEKAAKKPARKASKAPAAKAPAAKASGSGIDTGGKANSITGTITFNGKAPKNGIIRMNSDPVCVKLCADDEQRKETAIVGDNGELKDVMVFISKGLPKQDWPVKGGAVLIDQVKCRYVPHVVGVQLGQKVEIKNSDPTGHNVHFKSKLNGDWNMTQTKMGILPPQEEFRRPEVGTAMLKCDIHTWMNAKVNIFDHPFFGVTAADGTFTIEGVPAGEYTVTALHHKLKQETATVTVSDSGAATLNFEFSKKKGRR